METQIQTNFLLAMLWSPALAIATIILLFILLLFSTHCLRRLATDIFETFPHGVALAPMEALLRRFFKSAPKRNPQIFGVCALAFRQNVPSRIANGHSKSKTNLSSTDNLIFSHPILPVILSRFF